MGEVIGYARVSTAAQNTVRQDVALADAGAKKVFVDHASGKTRDARPELVRCLEYVREGDVLVVASMDRLARSLPDLLSLVNDLGERGVSVRFLRESVTVTPKSTDPMSTLLMQLLGAVAQFERELILERQREGIAQAKAAGVYRGRKPVAKSKLDVVRQLVQEGTPLVQAAREVGVSRSVAYRAGIRAPH